MEYIEIKEQVKQKLPVPKDFEDSDNLLEFGLSSLMIMRLVNQWRKQGIKVPFGCLMEHPTFGEWWNLIQRSMKKKSRKKKEDKKVSALEKDMRQMFPLTDVQYAYWAGRDDEQALGGIGCHAYLEFDGEQVAPEQLEYAWNRLQYHHPMLRACFPENGMQMIQDKPYCEKIKINDFTHLPRENAEQEALLVRERLSHRKLRIEEGEVAGLELTLLPENRTRLHVDIDLLIADVQSLQIVLRDLSAVYNGGDLPAESKEWNFASYLARQEIEDKEEKKKAKEYWRNRLEDLPKGPEIPLAKRPEEIHKTVFDRKIIRIEKEEWENLQKRAKEYKITPAMVLLTAYAAVLERWSTNKKFLINIPFFNRKTEYQGLEEVIADFTTLLLLEINCEGKPSFLTLLERIQKQLHEDMKYTAYSGVQIQRDLTRMYGDASAIAPIVFACNLGTPLVNDSFMETFGRFSYMISQTPQVWNDFQSYEDENGIQLTWDSVDELFPPDMIQDMLQSFENLLHKLGTEEWDQNFDVLPEDRKKFLEESCTTGEPEQPQCLHSAFLDIAEKHPQDIALEDTGKRISISYHALKEQALAVAAGIMEKGIRGVPVAITLPRGYEQIVAALGILISGNIYLPVSCNQPKERRRLIHDRTGAGYVLTNQELQETLEWAEGTGIFVLEDMKEKKVSAELPEVSPEDSAYIIMTSGSTGVPKGVEIAHGSAWNTIEDINEKYQVSGNDRALAVSAMDFDLSVYDIFGLLGAGGTLILLPEQEKRNADYWFEQVKRYQVTIWNSVPVLLDMLLIRAETANEHLPLRVIMLSGDWIGMDIPERVASLTESCAFAAMGGATEASIWSNLQEVTLPLPAHWKSVPYGRPLKHQAYRVVDEYGRDCPYWAEGELWIGGYGTAKGYRGDAELTEEKFITEHCGRWYRTGDSGRIWRDGTIEFLGRRDHQVKIRGHRIELGEIEHAIQRFPGVRYAIADTFSDGHGNRSLAAYIEAPLEEGTGMVSMISGKDVFSTGWERMRQSVHAWDMRPDQKADYEKFLTYADRRSIRLIQEMLEALKILTPEKDFCTVEEIISTENIAETHKPTVLRWLNILKEEHILQDSNGRLVCTGANPELPEKSEDVEAYFQQLQPYIEKMLRGEVEALDVFYQKIPSLAPNMLLQKIPGHNEVGTELERALKELVAEHKGAPLQILEIATRDTTITRTLLNALESVNTAYTYADSSKYFLHDIQKELVEFEGIEFELLDLGESLDKQQMAFHSYDIVIAVNALHRNHNTEDAARKISQLLSPNGVFLMSDLVVKTYLQDVTAVFLENSFTDIRDKRKEFGLVTPDVTLWKEYLSKAGLGERSAEKEGYGRFLYCGRQKESVLVYDERRLQEYLLEKLPEYMVPQNYHFMEQLPSLSNGKINRKQLQEDFKGETAVLSCSKAVTNTEEKLLNIWKNLFGFENLGTEDNYFTLGGDSLVATRLISEVQKVFGCKITIGAIFENLTVKSLAKVIEQSEKRAAEIMTIQPDTGHMYEDFPLTDVQHAYWIGRSGLYDLGNVSTHCYFELDAEELDTERAEQAWNLLVQRHGMMRAVIQPNGKQRILEHAPAYHIAVMDVQELDEAEKSNALEKKREEMSHQIIRAEEWPLFDVQITKITDCRRRIHISFDNIIFDGWSMFHILNEWAEVYRNGETQKPVALSFRDYVTGLEKLKTMSVYETDKRYWGGRIPNFADAPNLPTVKNEKQITEQRFCRRSAKLSRREWNSLKAAAGKTGVTPSVLLITAYAEALRLWSSNKDFTINLTQFDRKPLHPDVNALIGDFTTLTLLEICDRKGTSFSERAKAVQKQLSEDLEHSSYSAIELERELKKKAGNMQGALMPIVFTSGLGVEQWNQGKWLGKLAYNISQTPQVWLDHQVVEMDGCLCLFWDSVDELFYPGMLDEMFGVYVRLLQKIAKEPLIAEMKKESLAAIEISKARNEANETQKIFDEKTLDEMFMEAAEKFPDKEAVVSAERRMTYQELRAEALYVSEQLQAEGVSRGETVAVLMEKGWEQVTAVYGILFSGAVYLPVDIHNPQDRIEKILHDSNTRIILTQQDIKNDEAWLKNRKQIQVCGQKPDHMVQPVKNIPESLAYVIYTSGTTGIPKGVMISHHNAVNTILDINSRYQITEKDAAFGISNLHFDLSVYDIFGILGAGGTLVIPDPVQLKNPAHWITLLNTEGITVWNSVPAFVEMLAEYEEHQKQLKSQALRLILMSGDWVPVSLPERIRNISRNIRITALGGATEASIWSNSFDIPEAIPEHWKSIPYGKPLANQRYYVLDQNFEHCPDWVPGMLYIAGDGVARGYLNDKERTDEKFIISKETGEHLYCTGDMGRYWNDGNIEFLGRMDQQIKINGYRVELGEIESALLKIQGITDAVVFLNRSGSGNVVRAVLVEDKEYYEREIGFYREALKEKLPSYMIPSEYIKIEAIPLTANGKKDTQALQLLAERNKSNTPEADRGVQTALNPMQEQLLEIWREILKDEKISIMDNFFEVGGNSLQAIQITNLITERTGHQTDINHLFEHPTISEIEKYIAEAAE